MKLQKRDCAIDFEVKIATQRWQRISMTINGEKHEHLLSAAISDMFGNLVDVLYEMYIEANDDSQTTHVKYLHDNAESTLKITGITANLGWDNEGDYITWNITRQLYTDEIMLQIEIVYDYGDRLYKYYVPYFDMCYAVAKAATAALKKTGIIGYHYLGEIDKIDIHHLLYIKYLGIFKKPLPLIPIDGHQNNPYTHSDRVTSFDDEIELLLFDM